MLKKLIQYTILLIIFLVIVFLILNWSDFVAGFKDGLMAK